MGEAGIRVPSVLFGGWKRVSILLLGTLAVLLTGCSSGKSKKAATEAINKGLKRELVMMSIDIGRVGEKCGDIPAFVTRKDLTTQTDYQALQKAGLITITPDGPDFWRVELVDPKPSVVEALKKVPHRLIDGCDSMRFAFIVASKAVAEIVSIHEITSEKAEAEYTWKWALYPTGVKLIDKLTQPELVQVNANLEDARGFNHPDPTFNLVDMVQSSTPRPGKKMLKKSEDGWLLDE